MTDVDVYAPHKIRAEQITDAIAALDPGLTMRVEHDGDWQEPEIRNVLELCGLVNIQPFTDGERCGLEGTKPQQPAKPKAGGSKSKLVGVMSMPRLAFTSNMFCAMRSAVAHNFQIEMAQGVFWGQCLERVMTPHVEAGDVDYFLTIDYDSLFTPEHITRLIELMDRTPDAAAIAAWQVKRDDESMLFKPIGSDGTPRTMFSRDELDAELMEVAWAHFGLTLIRASALTDIPHPWFCGMPNADGRWEEGRTDDDIYFWNKLRDHGKRVFVANHVAIGHAQLVATWPDADFKARHQYMSDWNNKGMPEWARR